MSSSWYNEPSILFERPLDFFPSRGMTPEERLNSVVRFVLYASIAVSLYKSDPTMFGIGVCIVLALSLVNSRCYVKESDTTTDECEAHADRDIRTPKCTVPTEDNPFMNVLPHEFASNKPAACRLTNATLDKSDAYFDKGLPREISDVYRKKASDRQFMTMPATGNNGNPDTLAFRNYLYSETIKGPKCKA